MRRSTIRAESACVLEVGRYVAGIVECHASPRALDALVAPAGVQACRVAPDELLLLMAPARLDEVMRRSTAHLAVLEPGGLVVDQSDGWTIFGLPGEAGQQALRQLTEMPLPARRPAFLQGSVAGGAAKLILLPGIAFLLVPFALRDHLERRLRDVGAPGEVKVATAESLFAGPEA
jgi:hypothetical protein